HQRLTLDKAPQHRRRRADVHGLRADVHEVVEDAGNFAEENTDILCTLRHLALQQLFGCEHEGMLLTHRRDIIETVEIGHRLHIGLVFDQLLGAAMEEADMRINPLDHLAVQLHHEAQHAVRRRMLRAEIERVILDLDFSHQPFSSAFSSPGRTYFAPSHGLSKSNRRNSWVRLTGSYMTRFSSSL